MAEPRWIVIDDTDPTIQYSPTGSWFPVNSQGNQDAVGNFGPAYRSTLHRTNLNASLSLNFNGSQISVFGCNNPYMSGVLDPSWECFVDGISIESTTPFQFPENNWILCTNNSLVDGPHVLTVNATVTNSQIFWLDRIQYVPSLSVPLDGKSILVNNLDPQLLQYAYGPGWEAIPGDPERNMTEQTNSSFTFEFTGTSLSWYGIIPSQFPYAASTGSYIVDQGIPTNFTLPGLPLNSTTTLFSQLFFQTPPYAQGKHQISVLYQGNKQTTPLTLDYMIIRNGSASTLTPTVTDPGSVSTTSPAIPPSLTPTIDSSGKNVKAFIAGFVVGGVVLVALIFMLAVLYIRRQGKRLGIYSKLDSKNNSLAKVEGEVQPFTELPATYAQVEHPADPRQSSHSGNGENIWRIQIPNFGEKVRARRPIDLSVDSATGDTLPPTHTFPASTQPSLSRSEFQHTLPIHSIQVQDREGILPLLSDGLTSSTSRIYQHEDSGARTKNKRAEIILEIPPQYTAC